MNTENLIKLKTWAEALEKDRQFNRSNWKSCYLGQFFTANGGEEGQLLENMTSIKIVEGMRYEDLMQKITEMEEAFSSYFGLDKQAFSFIQGFTYGVYSKYRSKYNPLGTLSKEDLINRVNYLLKVKVKNEN